MQDIILTTLNARYIHASLGLRYLKANMGDLAPRTLIREFIINSRPIDIVEQLLALNPRIIGIGCYIWNITETTELVAVLKRVRPEITIVLGGPEISYETDQQPVAALADYVITGPADVSFTELCQRILTGSAPAERLITGRWVPMRDLTLPYDEYNDEDIVNRVIYVEASRGCPYKCEFCLSALDKTAWPFELDRFLAAMERLHRRGVRQFKFVDRTFNLNINTTVQIMQFFLDRLDDRLFLHFELIPDHLPEALKQMILRFPPGSLQFEVGVQTFDPTVQARISRKQDNDKTEANLRWLSQQASVHMHVDLIIGLPGEDIARFATGFDRLVGLGPEEIQVGILKRLRGAPIDRHSEAYDIRYSPLPPYTILSASYLDFNTLQRLSRFARYWDLIANSGRFRQTRPLLLGDAPFDRFMRLSDWLFQHTGQTHQISLERLFVLLHQAMIELLSLAPDQVETVLRADYDVSGLKGYPKFLSHNHSPQGARAGPARPARQQRHGHG